MNTIGLIFRARYHKYKGRYADVVKAYNELQGENSKVKTVMQQTQVIAWTIDSLLTINFYKIR
jgi:hypothetical protein